MTNGFIGLMLATGVGGWVYAKTMRRSGGNTKSSLTVAVIVGIFAFIIMLSLLSVLDNYLHR